jgi:hypothetical protein
MGFGGLASRIVNQIVGLNLSSVHGEIAATVEDQSAETTHPVLRR